METFSRVIFAVAGSAFGLMLGLVAVFVLGVIFLKLDANAQDNPGAVGLIMVFLPVGALLGSLVGLFVGIILPLRAKKKAKSGTNIAYLEASEDSWPPPPGF